jgi:hypothetical protein
MKTFWSLCLLGERLFLEEAGIGCRGVWDGDVGEAVWRGIWEGGEEHEGAGVWMGGE